MRMIGSASLRVLAAAVCVAAALCAGFAGCRGCAPAKEGPAALGGEELSTSFFRCDDGTEAVASVGEPDTMMLFLPDRTLKLKKVAAGSGARYGNGDVMFWPKETSAVLKSRDGERNCVEIRSKSVMEDARPKGATFWASGRDPAWTLRMGPDGAIFETDAGRFRQLFNAAQPMEDAANRMTIYRMIGGDHRLELVLRALPCNDPTDKETFTTTVIAIFDGKPLPGCGQHLD